LKPLLYLGIEHVEGLWHLSPFQHFFSVSELFYRGS
jgi:hypothetical protein